MDVPREIDGFRLGEVLGEGATSVVYAARNTRGERAAIKFLRAELRDQPEVLAQFVREARIAQAVQSEFIAPVMATGATRRTIWIMYRRIDGETLEARLRRDLVLAAADVRRFVDHVLQGLSAAHVAGVVHRDIKPSNIMLEGTVDPRADLYSVAVVAFRALTGQFPFAGASEMAMMGAKLKGQALTLGQATGARWPKPLETFFQAGLAHAPADRFADAREMRKAWSAAAKNDCPDVDGLRATLVASRDGEDTIIDS